MSSIRNRRHNIARRQPGSQFLIALLACLLSATALAQTRYTLVDLGTLGGAESGASAINASAAVVGWSETASGSRHAFLYRNGTLVDLGTLAGGTDSVATDINDAGLVVGFSGINAFGPAFPEATQAFAWQDRMLPLGALYCPCTFNDRYGSSSASAISETGQVVGSSETVRGEQVRHAFLFSDGAPRDLSAAGSWSVSRALDIGAGGVVVGNVAVAIGPGEDNLLPPRAAGWLNGEEILLGGLPGDPASSIEAINDLGVGVGWSGAADDGARTAVLFRASGLQALESLPGHGSSMALDINNGRQVVGWSEAAEGATGRRAVLWETDVAIDLNLSSDLEAGWHLLEASAINEAGEIVGTALYNGQQRAFLLRPAAPQN